MAELTYEYVARDKHFDWDTTVEALVELCPSSALAILSRWRDRRFGNARRLLPIAIYRLVQKKMLPDHAPIALAGLDMQWERPRDLSSFLSLQNDAVQRAKGGDIAYRYIRVIPNDGRVWSELSGLRDKYGLSVDFR